MDSTSLYLRQQARHGAPHGTVVVAGQQLAGRGRRGRQWHSPAAENLYFSILLRPSLELAQVPQLSLVSAAALWQALAAECPGLLIKWPNDLYCRGRKIAGILAEMQPDKTRAAFVVVGIGLNVNAVPADFPAELQGQVTSLAYECGRNFELSGLLERILQEFAVFVERFCRQGLAGSIQTLINRNFFLAGKVISMCWGEQKITCRARAIDVSGQLLAITPDGREMAFSAGEAWLEKRA
ncbi:MAG: biotin--[acetyl-CoA-carboxylase] ligase [Deltaproteobacteria bacterium]|nr:biotin--[acetyl-CoA-carboxylase] ligase [Deltaproteobacteria bacterium]